MAISDIVILCLIVLGMGIGYFKGFFKSIASLLSVIVCLVAAYFITTYSVDAITKIGFLNNALYGETNSLAASISGALPEGLHSLTVAAANADKGALSAAMGGGWMTVFSPLILSIVTKLAGTETLLDLPMADCIGVVGARSVAWLVCFIIFFVILRLFVALLLKLGGLMKKRPLSRTVDRVCGIIIGGAKGTLWAFVGVFLISLMSGLGFMAPYRADLEKSFLAKPMTDITVKLFGNFIDFGKITGGILGNTEAPEKTDESEKTDETEAAKSASAWSGEWLANKPFVGEYMYNI